jgi:hypothetical protein
MQEEPYRRAITDAMCQGMDDGYSGERGVEGSLSE